MSMLVHDMLDNSCWALKKNAVTPLVQDIMIKSQLLEYVLEKASNREERGFKYSRPKYPGQ